MIEHVSCRKLAPFALTLLALLIPSWIAQASPDCPPPTTWSDYIYLSCHVSSHVLVGQVRALTADSPSSPVLRYTMQPSRVFRGTLQRPDEFEFCMWAPDKRDSLLTALSDDLPAIGQSWLVFATAGLPPGHAITPDGAPQAFFLVPVDEDSVRTDGPLPSIRTSALLDTVAAVISQCTLTRDDSIRVGWR